MPTDSKRRPGRPPLPGGPTDFARSMNADRRGTIVAFNMGLMKIKESGDKELADEIGKKLSAAASSPGGGQDRSWLSAVEIVARFEPESQRWAWEQAQARGVRWLKRYVESSRNPPDTFELASRMGRWVEREYPAVPRSDIADALEILLVALRSDSETETS